MKLTGQDRGEMVSHWCLITHGANRGDQGKGYDACARGIDQEPERGQAAAHTGIRQKSAVQWEGVAICVEDVSVEAISREGRVRWREPGVCLSGLQRVH
jgi:hypothetical protein